MPATTIQLSTRTRAKLARLKASRRETYDELLNKLMLLVPGGDEEGRYSDEFRAGLLEARIATLRGDVVSHEEVKRRLGL